LIHNLSPTLLPSFIKLQIPAITTLHFRETECDSGLLKIYKQEDSWTLEGIIQLHGQKQKTDFSCRSITISTFGFILV
jgi:hypothetical protein